MTDRSISRRDGGKSMDKYEQLYASNSDFKMYVDKYVGKHNLTAYISVTEALKHILVKNYGDFILGKEKAC